MNTTTSTMTALQQRIQSNTMTLGVIGLGYVGLPLACEFAQAGRSVIGFDISAERVAKLNQGDSYIQDISSDALGACVSSGNLRATTDMADIGDVDVISICVPTPLRKTKDPDMSYILTAVNSLLDHVRQGQLVILESTTYPGTTQELIQPMFESKGFTIGTDLFLAFSPERVDPGNPTYTTKNTPKIVGGVTPACTQLAQDAYAHAIHTTVPVSSPKAAELVKLYENTFRSVNIALANELALMANKLGVDVWEVIDAAATKPFGFMPFYPGPGLGGHCIPIDPSYLSWKMKSLNYDARFVALAEQINTSMPSYVVKTIGIALNQHQKAVNGSRIVVAGVAYKPNINDMRESPALDILLQLRQFGADVCYTDAYVPSLTLADGHALHHVDHVTDADCIVIVTHHDYMDIPALVAASPVVVDTRNATAGITANHIVKL